MKVLPKVAAEVSAPLSQTEKITMVSDGDGPIGASKVPVHVQMQNNYTISVITYTGAICMAPSSRARYRFMFKCKTTT